MVLATGESIPFECLVSTMPAPELVCALRREAPDEVRKAAAGLRHVSVRCVNLGVGRTDLTDKHWIYYPEDTVFHRIFVQGNASPHCNAPGGFGLTCEITYSPAKPLPCDGAALIERYGVFVVFIPVWAFLLLPSIAALRSDIDDFLSRSAKQQWGLMVTVYCLSHAPALLMLEIPGQAGRGALLLFYLLLVVQMSDVMQYVFGKLFGKTKVAPVVSPSKTVEGLIGGGLAATAIGAAALTLIALTPLQRFAERVAHAAIPNARPIRELSQAGVPVCVMVAPVVPGLTDSEMPEILRAAKEAGAGAAGYILRFFGGDPLGSPEEVPLDREVPPGETVDISLQMQAPERPGKYTSVWVMSTTERSNFKEPVYLEIEVPGPQGPTGPQGPQGPAGTTEPDVPDMTLIFENGLI